MVERKILKFWKMHGASNDFIMFDDRDGLFPCKDKNWISAIANRRTGIGSEGVILIQKSKKADFRMRFFNPDGGEAEMCGNGARCAAKLAADIGAAPSCMTIETIAGILKAEILSDKVKLFMTEPKDWEFDNTITINNTKLNYSFVNTGVPHTVIAVKKLDSINVKDVGAKIRYHKQFTPGGTNVNFIQKINNSTIKIRTYERGVEDETLACGTGITASALIAYRKGFVKPPVRVIAKSGDTLVVDFYAEKEIISNVTLLGPAVYVFTGTIPY